MNHITVRTATLSDAEIIAANNLAMAQETEGRPLDGARTERPPTPAPQEPINEDLYCLHCAYNLRGLSGNPVRCPECGKLNTRDDLDCPPKMVGRRARRMETAAALCFLSVTGFLGSVVFSLLSGEYGCFWCASILAPLPWAIGSTEFKNGCLAETGWMRVLLRNHGYLTVMLCIALTTWALGSAAVWGIDSLVHPGSTLTWRHCLWGAGLALVALLWTRALTKFNRPREAAIDRLARAAVRYEVRVTR